MIDTYDKVVKLQGERLAVALGLKPGIFFSVEELTTIARSEPFGMIEFRGKPARMTMSSKALADLILIKISKEKT